MDSNILVNLYCNENLSLTEIAKQLGSTRKIITSRLKKLGIKIKKSSEQRNLITLEISKDDLYDLYVTQQLSSNEIAKQYNVTRKVIINRLLKFNIPIRNLIEYRKIKFPFNRDLVNIENITKLNENKTLTEIAHEIGCGKSYISHYLLKNNIPCKQHFKSSIEKKIEKLLIENNIFFSSRNRNIIYPKELDIYIPDKNIAIEVNGVFWHSELNGKDKNYHLTKLKMCEEKGITLLQFWDNEINDKWNIVESIILNKCGILHNKIGARQCEIFYPSKNEEERFLNENHIQGYNPSTFCLGLHYNNTIVSIMSFKKPRYNKNYDWELLRFCNKINYSVQGSASKLFKNRPQGNIISYADKRYSQGNLYKILEFKWLHNSTPDYFYTKDYKTFYHRSAFQKHKLSTLLENFNPSLTEWENMQNNGYDRIWDCGNSTWIFE